MLSFNEIIPQSLMEFTISHDENFLKTILTCLKISLILKYLYSSKGEDVKWTLFATGDYFSSSEPEDANTAAVTTKMEKDTLIIIFPMK